MTTDINTVSIITICYNNAEGLKKTINSVISQTYTNIEYIVIDGGSKDNTLDIIKQNENHISYWVSEPDKGIYDAMNKGIKAATGEWVIMMNSGDIFANENVLKSIFSKEIPDTKTFLYSDIYCPNEKGEPILRRMSFDDGILIHQSTIYRRKLHNEHGFYINAKPIIISDYIFFYSIPNDEVMKVEVPIAYFEGGGISSQGNWALQQIYCLDVVFRRRSFNGMILAYYWKMVKAIIPISWKDRIKSWIGR